MTIRRIKICCFLVLTAYSYLGARSVEEADVLLVRAAFMANPYQQVDSLNEWAWICHESQPDLALRLAQEALKISQESRYRAGEGDAYKRLGVIHRILGNTEWSLQSYLFALAIKQPQGDELGVASIQGNIGNIYLDQKEYALALQYYHPALEINLRLGKPAKAVLQLNGIGAAHEGISSLDSAIFYFRKAIKMANEIADGNERILNLARCWNNLASPFKAMGGLDSAAFYWNSSLQAFASLGEDLEVANVLNNLGLLELDQSHPKLAIDSFFLPALRLALTGGERLKIQDITYNLAQAHEQAQHPDSALHYLKQYQVLHDTLFNQDKSKAFAKLETQHQVKEKDARNQLLQLEGQRKTVVISAISVVAILVGALAVLFIYYQRKRLKTQQELSLRKQQQDAQRIVELVQTQEVRSLEALVEGQEQERNRLASELHDGLGSLLATVKLYFNQLEVVVPTQQSALQKADQMLDEACQEVRRYSHDLAGLPVTQFGLLNAVRNLAESISGAGKLQVRVYAHQMEERLPLPMERTIYKVVQELLTNVIKHAHATQVTIQFSRHEAHLNLILEDNGRGMANGIQQSKSGLGLSSIKARLEALSAEFTLDSNPGHGTTALIDIPLNILHND